MSKRVVTVSRQAFDRCVHRDEKIRACQGVYPAVEVATHFGLTRKTVYEIWKVPGDQKIEPPNIKTEKHRPDYEDILILCNRGLSLVEVAGQLGSNRDAVARVLRTAPRGREALIRDREAMKRWRAGRNDPRGSYGYPTERYDWQNRI